MALVVLRVYAMLSEAQVAAGALRAAGLEPVLLDQAAAPPYSGLTSMGGFRLAVSDAEADEAVEILRAAVIRPLPEARGVGGEPEDLVWEPPAGASMAELWRDGLRGLKAAPAQLTPVRLGLLALAALLAAASAWAVHRAMGL